jgi:hypothetical protein
VYTNTSGKCRPERFSTDVITNKCFGNCHTLNKNFLEELIACFPLIRHCPHRNDAFNDSSLPRKRLYLVDTYQRYTNRSRHTVLLLLRVFVVARTCLPSRCLAMKGGIHYTEPIPCNDGVDSCTYTQTDGIYVVHQVP